MCLGSGRADPSLICAQTADGGVTAQGADRFPMEIGSVRPSRTRLIRSICEGVDGSGEAEFDQPPRNRDNAVTGPLQRNARPWVNRPSPSTLLFNAPVFG